MTTNPLRGGHSQTAPATKEHAEAKVRQFNTLPWVIESGSLFYVKQKEDGSWTWNCQLGQIPQSDWRVKQAEFDALIAKIGRAEFTEGQLNNLPDDRIKRVADCNDFIRLGERTKRYVYRRNTLKLAKKQADAA